MAALGFDAVAVDPLYAHAKHAIAGRIAHAREIMMAGVRAEARRFVWNHYRDPDGLERTRLSAMKFFLEDYEEGRRAGRYIAAALPRLPFAAGRFDLALSSHYLLLYSDQLDLDAHLAAVREMLRVAGEVRIFPLLDLAGRPSRHLDPLRRALAAEDAESEIRPVAYEFQKDGNELLRVVRRDFTKARR